MIFAILDKAARDDELILVDGGMCHFKVRKDGVITVHEIIVLPSHRRKGIARSMILRLQKDHPGYPIRSLCPVSYESNKFWERMGFVHKGVKQQDGGKEGINIWVLEPTGDRTPDEVLPITPPERSFVMRSKKRS